MSSSQGERFEKKTRFHPKITRFRPEETRIIPTKTAEISGASQQ